MRRATVLGNLPPNLLHWMYNVSRNKKLQKVDKIKDIQETTLKITYIVEPREN